MTIYSHDFTPLYRASVGFDRIAGLMDRVLTTEVAQPTYPPYNLEKLEGDACRISIAVAGFSPDELTVKVNGALHVARARRLRMPRNPVCTAGSPPARLNAALSLQTMSA